MPNDLQRYFPGAICSISLFISFEASESSTSTLMSEARSESNMFSANLTDRRSNTPDRPGDYNMNEAFYNDTYARPACSNFRQHMIFIPEKTPKQLFLCLISFCNFLNNKLFIFCSRYWLYRIFSFNLNTFHG